MWRNVLADPKVRRAYILTKAGVFTAAAIVTVPLAHFLGPKAWVGLGVFGLVLVALTVGVLSAGKSDGAVAEPGANGGDQEEDSDPSQPVDIPVEDFIDLHPFSPRDIPSVVESYLETAMEQGYGEVRLIHGRGIGVQRDRVRSVLSKHPQIVSFSDAPSDRGGWGATLVKLRRPE